jgi:hypothetical protein
MSSRRFAVIAALTASTLLLSGCTIPLRPAWWHHPKPSAGSKANAKSGNGAQSSPPAPAVPQVANVWQPGMQQLGIDVYWQANTHDSDSVIQAKARRIINYAISLGCNSITLTFPFYTYGLDSDVVYADPATSPSPAHIAIFLSEAAQSHVRVTLRPVLNEDILVEQNPQAWRGAIQPEVVSAWFVSYQQFLIPYAKVAAAGQAATFVIGTELDSLQGDPEWPGLVNAVKAVYPGQILYDENYLDFAGHADDLPVADFGVDAYPRFPLPDSTPVSQLAGAWEGWLGSHRPAVLRNTILSEVGIDAVSGSYDDPGAWVGMAQAPIDQAVQANWYAAVCQAVGADDLAGVYWWDVNFDAQPADPAPSDVGDPITFIGRSAQSEIKTCFTQLASATTASPSSSATAPG